MSLVDYASDDGEGEEPQTISEAPKIEPRPNSTPLNQKVEQPARQHSPNATPSSRPTIEKLPDASLLLSSPNLSSHIFSSNNLSSRVTASLAENASRKRAANRSPPSSTQTKLPKGTLSHSRNVSANGLLVPPQLSGRSNIVTEDISKLFVKRQADHPSQ
ncbi:hypothetical protein QQ045_025682 [Rhodiola kirilowii]